MLLHQRANYADQKHKPQKINMLFKTSQYETSCKNNARLLSQNEEPTRANSTARAKFIGTSIILARGKTHVFPNDPLLHTAYTR